MTDPNCALPTLNAEHTVAHKPGPQVFSLGQKIIEADHGESFVPQPDFEASGQAS